MTDIKIIRQNKQELEIDNVYPEKPYGNANGKLVKFSALNLTSPGIESTLGKPQIFTVFIPELQSHIKVLSAKAHVIADVQERESQNKEYAPDRVITQIYVNDKPVFFTRTQMRPWQKPVESQDQRSVEARAAMFEVGSYIRVIDDDVILPDCIKRCVEKYWRAVERSLDNFLDTPALARTQEKPSAIANASPTTNAGK
jgi:hypothetical protein